MAALGELAKLRGVSEGSLIKGGPNTIVPFAGFHFRLTFFKNSPHYWSLSTDSK